MRILGIDPGSAVTGFGVIDCEAGRLVHVTHGTLRPPRGAPLAARLDYLHREIGAAVRSHEPAVAAVEQVFVSASPRSALVLGQARGALLAAVAGSGTPVVEYASRRIKQSVTGSGGAGKAQVQTMVRRLLALLDTPGSDAADALAAAICHAHTGRLVALGSTARRRGPRSTLRVRRAL